MEPACILVVEDNLADQYLFREGTKEADQPVSLHFATNGEEALSFLRRQGRFASSPRPDVVLLDLNLPLKDGREVLTEIKQDPALKEIPVIILSTSSNPEDMSTSYDLGASSYLVKPSDFNDYMALVKKTIEYCYGLPSVKGR